MDIRKRACKLFKDIESFAIENNLKTDSMIFLLNRLHLFEIGKRSSSKELKEISKKDFGEINKKFRDRLPVEILKYLSISRIITLPEEDIIDACDLKIKDKRILFLSNKIVVSRTIEINNFICFSNPSFKLPNLFSDNISISPVKRNQNVEVSAQATLFELINNTQNMLRPDYFDMIFDETIYSEPLSQNFILNITHLLKKNGVELLFTKKNFYISSASKKIKTDLYNSFNITKIDEKEDHLVTELTRKDDSIQKFTIIKRINDSQEEQTFDQTDLTFNNLLTFDISLKEETLSLIKKIELASKGKKASDCFKFFIGMFPSGKNRPQIMRLRLNSKFRHFIRSHDIEAFKRPESVAWIFPDPSKFSQMPKIENMERDKLLIRYLSSRPVLTIDRSKIYFLNDTAAIIPKTDNISLEYAEAYFNSSLIEFYYTLRFPQNNKFLKKNFQKIPFVDAGTTIQNIISEAVEKFKLQENSASIFDYTQQSEEKDKVSQRKRIDKFIYQLFSLTPQEITLIEKYTTHKKEN